MAIFFRFLCQNICQFFNGFFRIYCAAWIIWRVNDNFITFAPYFPEYKCFVESVGSELKVVPANIDTFQINFEKFEEMIDEHTKGIIMNSPNNPSGAVYSEETIKKLADILTKKSEEYGHPIFIISDEPYREVVYEGAEVPYVTKYYANTLVCYSYSKSFSLAGERIGYIVVPNEVAEFANIYAAVAGAGYVGMSMAVLLSQKHNVTVIDVVASKVDNPQCSHPESETAYH